MAVQVSATGSYWPPVFTGADSWTPPAQTSIRLPVHTAVWRVRPEGALIVDTEVQLSVRGLYLPPVSATLPASCPRQTTMLDPVQTAVREPRAVGEFVLA